MVIAWDVLNSPETLFELAGGEFHFGFGAVDQRRDPTRLPPSCAWPEGGPGINRPAWQLAAP